MAAGRKSGGRQKGSRNKRTLAREEMVKRAGAGLVATTPLDFMLSVMTNNDLPLAMRLDAAVMAAPYIHKRLQAVKHAQIPSGPSDLERLLDELDGRTRCIPSQQVRRQ